MLKRLIILVFIFNFSSVFAKEADQKIMTKAEMKSLIKAYDKRSNHNGKMTVKDVDYLFEILAADFIYNRPKYNVIYSRRGLYRKLVKYIKSGKYETSPVIKYDNEIIGLNSVILEWHYPEEKDKSSKVTLFEFKDGKIHLIKEYW